MVPERGEAYGLARTGRLPDKPRHEMSRYERNQYFESLWAMRDAYATRAAEDRSAHLSIADALAYAEAVMLALDAEDIAGYADDPLVTETTPPTAPATDPAA
jgi:hypothetical protein